MFDAPVMLPSCWRMHSASQSTCGWRTLAHPMHNCPWLPQQQTPSTSPCRWTGRPYPLQRAGGWGFELGGTVPPAHKHTHTHTHTTTKVGAPVCASVRGKHRCRHHSEQRVCNGAWKCYRVFRPLRVELLSWHQTASASKQRSRESGRKKTSRHI